MKNIDLRLNYPLLPGQDAQIKELLQSALDQTGNLLSLAPGGGDLTDRQIAAKWLSQPGYTVDAENVFMGSGGHHCIVVSILAAGLQHKKIVADEMTYSNFKSIAQLMNMQIIPCKTDEHGIIPGELSAICKSANPDAIYLMSTVSNPLGTVIPLNRRHEIAAIAKENNLLIIEDDAYGFLEEEVLPTFFHLAPERSFYIYSLAKPFAQGIKTSYLLAPAAYAQKINEALRSTGSNPSWFLSKAASDMIESGSLKSLIEAKRKEGRSRQQKTRELLSDYQLNGHKNGWHIWLTLPDGLSSSELNENLLKRGVEIVPSGAFSVANKSQQQGIRIALGGEMDFNRVVEGLNIIKEEIEKL